MPLPLPLPLLLPFAHAPQLFKRLHAAYVDTTSNPFHTFGAPLKSGVFEAAVEAVAGAFPKGLPSASSLTSSSSYA